MAYIRSSSLVVTGVLLPILGAVVVSSRFYSRRLKRAPLGLDDWLCLPALVNSKRVVVTDPDASPRAGPTIRFEYKLSYAFSILQPLTLGTIKLSILFFYRRIFQGQTFSLISWVLITLVVLWTLGFSILGVFACGTHFARYLDKSDSTRYCANGKVALLVSCISDVVLDIAILVLPIPLVAVVAGILRLVAYVKIRAANGYIYGMEHKPTAALTTRIHDLGKPHLIFGVKISNGMAISSLLVLLANIETGVALIAACLPTLRPLFQAAHHISLMKSIRNRIAPERSHSRTRSKPSEDHNGVERALVDDVVASTQKAFCSYGSTLWLEAYMTEQKTVQADENHIHFRV
ncbi:MAG: hypothetical protein Q9219_000623 [cf. Caloplaca sp. 3 TL-2023]